VRLDVVNLDKISNEFIGSKKCDIFKYIVNYKTENDYRMYILCAEMNEDTNRTSSTYSILKNRFKQEYILFKQDLNKENEFNYTMTFEKSCLQNKMNLVDKNIKECSLILQSNWCTK